MIALVYDLKAYRVPNWLIVAGWILGISCRTLAGGLEGSLWWIVGVGVIGIFFIPFALLHMFGAGDVKLFMVTGGFFGVSFTIQYAVVALFCGAVFSVGKMLWHRNLLDRLRYLASYFYVVILGKEWISYGNHREKDTEAVIPFVLPMAAGYGIVVYRMWRYGSIGVW